MCCVRPADFLRTSGFRTGLLFMGLFGLGSLILFGAVYHQTVRYLGQQSEDWLSREIAGRVHSSEAERIVHLDARLPTDPGEHRPFALFAADGRLIAGAMATHPTPPVLDQSYAWRTVTSAGRPIEYRTMAHRLPNGELLVVGLDIDEADDFSEMIVHALLTGGGVMLALGLIGAIVLGAGSAYRIDRMRLAIERIVAGQLSERLPVSHGHGDLERLAIVVNGMLDELERMVGEVKGVCDNLAHDMRTPLGRLLAGLERAQRRDTGEPGLRDAIETAIGELKEILLIFAALLRISEIEDGVRRSGFEALDLVRIAEDAIDYHRPVAEARGVRLDLSVPSHVPIDGDSGLLFEAIANLLDNAIKFSGTRGHVALSIAPGPIIRVADDGPGIPVEERQAVMRRFQRGEASRHLPGNGLGLPLVAAIARLHGLALDIRDGHPGCVVSLRPADRAGIPVAAADTARPASIQPEARMIFARAADF